VNALT